TSPTTPESRMPWIGSTCSTRSREAFAKRPRVNSSLKQKSASEWRSGSSTVRKPYGRATRSHEERIRLFEGRTRQILLFRRRTEYPRLPGAASCGRSSRARQEKKHKHGEGRK